MNIVSPESKGISSRHIQDYIEFLEKNNASTHSVIIMRGGEVVFEKYWAPFHKDFLHRQYSASKSFVAIAVGFAIQDGLLDLDDPMIKHFPEELKNQKDENMRNQTVRHMLMMSTAKITYSWFAGRPEDRVAFYFANDRECSRPSGTIFQYDSAGSFVLGALVEKVTGKPLDTYLHEKMFSKIGVSKDAYFLKCPGGWAWGDSALVCTSRDMLRSAQFMMNGGRWNGEQILNEEYVRAATTKRIDNSSLGANNCWSHGYGYLFWIARDNAFFFNGMGCQYALCVPEKDLIFIHNADDQGRDDLKKPVLEKFFELVVDRMSDEPLPEDAEAQKALHDYVEPLILQVAKGEMETPWTEKINGVTYELGANDMGITKFRLDFNPDGTGKFVYTNAQGDKELPFGMGKNVFAKFPQTGYSDQVGSQSCPGHQYDCCASAAWIEPHKLYIKVHIIDAYLGVLNMFFGFKDDTVGIFMNKTAEDFLNEYQGYAGGVAVTD
jgi:CubicO group peptidase (beta-lactamase class C family)